MSCCYHKHVESLPHNVKVTNINLHLPVVSSVFYVHTVYAEIPEEYLSFELCTTC